MDFGVVERVRRIVSVVAMTVFTTSFFLLLVLSATPQWVSENLWLDRLQLVLRSSGLSVLVLSLLHPAGRALAQISVWLGLGGGDR